MKVSRIFTKDTAVGVHDVDLENPHHVSLSNIVTKDININNNTSVSNFDTVGNVLINNVAVMESIGNAGLYNVEFTFIRSEVKNPDHSYTTINFEVPSNWSRTAADILVQNYFKLEGVPTILKKVSEEGIPLWLQRSEADIEALSKLDENIRYRSEVSAKEVFNRIAGCWTYWGYKEKYFSSEDEAKIFYNEILYILANQIASPNSPQWFNTGLHWAYGILGKPHGYYFFNEKSSKVEQSFSSYERPQPNSCFVQSVEDDLVNKNGVMDLVLRESKLFKYGAGTGSNFSKIRAKGEKLSDGGTSSGVLSFLQLADTSAGVIKSGGITKRSSKMVVLDADHPEIEAFIQWKVKEEQKLISLITGSQITYKIIQIILNSCKNYKGLQRDRFDINKNTDLKNAIFLASNMMMPEKYIQKTIMLAKQSIYEINFSTFSTGWNSEGYSVISAQNSKNFVSINNTFMNKVKYDEDWHLINRGNGEVSSTIKAPVLWNQLAKGTWDCSSVGIFFSSTVNEWHTCPNDGTIVATNPCSEFIFLDDTACNLASINLMHFRKNNATFDVSKFQHVIKLLTIALDISIAMAQFPSENTALLTHKFRPFGIGYANLGSYLMSVGLGYDSDEGRNTCACITSLLSASAYYYSSQIAKKKGVFLAYGNNSEAMLSVIKNHRNIAHNVKESYENLSVKPIPLQEEYCVDKKLYTHTKKAWDKVLESATKHGFRNAQVTCIAPTGTIGLLMDCATPGIEPDFSLVKYKSHPNGEYDKSIHESVPLALKRLGYSEEEIQAISYHAVGHKNIKDAPFINHNSLKKRGFTDLEIAKVEKSLDKIFNIEFAFSIYILGEAFCKNVLKLDIIELKNPNISLLKAIGFKQKEIEEANNYVTGSMNLENAPFIKKEHISIFDCSEIFGKKATRYLSYKSHIRMLASAQAFISGGISKNIILPTNATIQDCEDAYMMAWGLGVKTCSIYRNGYKLSQPLQSSIFGNDIMSKTDLLDILLKNNIVSIIDDDRHISKDSILKLSEYAVNHAFRNIPKANIAGYKQRAKIEDIAISIKTKEFDNGSLAEISLNIGSDDKSFKEMVNCFAIAISLGLQYGVPLDEFVDIFISTQFKPFGKVEGHEHITTTTSIIDYIFRDLAINYLGRQELTDKEEE